VALFQSYFAFSRFFLPLFYIASQKYIKSSRNEVLVYYSYFSGVFFSFFYVFICPSFKLLLKSVSCFLFFFLQWFTLLLWVMGTAQFSRNKLRISTAWISPDLDWLDCGKSLLNLFSFWKFPVSKILPLNFKKSRIVKSCWNLNSGWNVSERKSTPN
jgi:hypothetical protein